MVRLITAALILPLNFLTIQTARSETIDGRLAWPRVLKESFGNPEIKIIQSIDETAAPVTFLRPARTVFVRTRGIGGEEVNRLLASYFSGLFWDRFLSDEVRDEFDKRLNLREIIPLTKREAVRIGTCQMLGRSSGSATKDAWWKVRTGSILTESTTHLLGIASLEWDEEGAHSFGHYAICLRQRGGNADGDSIYDFRAPWREDRRPRFTEGPNFHNRLKISALQQNLYDWAYTQSEHRNCNVTLSFFKVSEEQVLLLQSFNGRVHEAGNFRAFKKNCTSLGTRFMNRILPVDEPVPGKDAAFDIPNRAREATLKRFGGIITEVGIENVTDERGRKPTNKTDIHPAEPSRGASRPFRILKDLPEIN